MAIEERYRGVKKSRTFSRIHTQYQLGSLRVLDIGCGHGEYLINFGTGSVGLNSSASEVDYGKENNLQMIVGNAEKLEDSIKEGEVFECIWANNLFEHLLSPHAFLIKLRKFTTEESLLILGVPVFPRIPFLFHLNKFRGALASNHISFFNNQTLVWTVKKAGWTIIEERPFFSKFKIVDWVFKFLTPHMFIVCRKDPEFSYPPKKIMEWEDQEYYQDLLNLSK